MSDMSSSEVEYDNNIIIELNKNMDEYMEELAIDGFVKIETYEKVDNCMSKVSEFIDYCDENDIEDEASSQYSYKLCIGSKYIKLTYLINLIYERFDPVHHYILLDKNGETELISLNKHHKKSIKDIRKLCDEYKIEAAGMRTKSARNH